MLLGKLTFQSLKCISEFRLGKLQAKSTVATKAFANSIFNWSFTHHIQKTQEGKLLSCDRWERFSRKTIEAQSLNPIINFCHRIKMRIGWFVAVKRAIFGENVSVGTKNNYS